MEEPDQFSMERNSIIMNPLDTMSWQEQLQKSIKTPSELITYLQNKGILVPDSCASKVAAKPTEKLLNTIQRTTKKYPMQISPYYIGLIQSIGDPIWKQAIPDAEERHDDDDDVNVPDPLCEEPQSPVPSIIHRYPDRVIFLVSNRCAVYCRHCMRKRKVGMETTLFFTSSKEAEPKSYIHSKLPEIIEKGITYISEHKEIFDVILSGGDPLLLDTEMIDRILTRIRAIDHVQTLRIHTRAICTLPSRITENLVSVLKQYHPIYINTHFNHPMELTDDAASACARLADAGIPLGCQSVLLRGINDTPEVMTQLMRGLLRIRIRPYYLHHPDAVTGTAHFRLPLAKGLEIIKAMRGHISGMAIPHYVIDLPGGHGKIPVTPDYLKSVDEGYAAVENYEGKMCKYFF